MTIDAQQAVELLDSINNDPEEGHNTAEEVLLDLIASLGHPAVVEAWRRCKKRNGFWYS